MSGECLSFEEIPPEHKTPKFPPRPCTLPPPLVRNDMEVHDLRQDFGILGIDKILA